MISLQETVPLHSDTRSDATAPVDPSRSSMTGAESPPNRPTEQSLKGPAEELFEAGPALERLGQTLARIEARIGTLEQGLVELASKPTTPGAPAIEDISAAGVGPMVWPEIVRAYTAVNGNSEALRDQLTYSSIRDVLRRFGRPTNVTAEGAWLYERPELDQRQPRLLILNFVNGYVSGAIARAD